MVILMSFIAYDQSPAAGDIAPCHPKWHFLPLFTKNVTQMCFWGNYDIFSFKMSLFSPFSLKKSPKRVFEGIKLKSNQNLRKNYIQNFYHMYFDNQICINRKFHFIQNSKIRRLSSADDIIVNKTTKCVILSLIVQNVSMKHKCCNKRELVAGNQ